MQTITIGQQVPDFELPSTGNQNIKLSSLKGKNVVLYFYPKDDTPGCTTEGIEFRDHFEEFQQANTLIFGISRDNLKSHEAFKSKFSFPFDLLSDEEERVCKIFDVIKPKNMYGKTVLGIERSTFLVDKEGVLRQEWRKVKVDKHISDVLDAVKNLSK